MRKHLFSFIAAASLLFAGGQSALADDGVTLGYVVNNPASTSTTTTINQTEDVVVTMIKGKQGTGTNKKSMYQYGSETSETIQALCYRSKASSAVTTKADTVYFGYTMSVASGKLLNLSAINLELCTGENFSWNLSIYNAGEECVYTSGDKTVTNYSKTTATNKALKVDVSSIADLQKLSGTVTVKLYYWLTSGNESKYILATTFNTTGTIEEGQAATPTCKNVTFTKNAQFDFAQRAYTVNLESATPKVTIKYTTSTEADAALESEYTTALPISTEGTTIKAQASRDGYDASEITSSGELKAAAAYDADKKYIAWVYENGYKDKLDAAYDYTQDPMYLALKESYNVVPVNYSSSSVKWSDECSTLNKADLIYVTEAITGNGSLCISLKDLAGEVPMVNMKAFAYKSDRWGWATGVTESTGDVAVTPANENFKIFDGVTISDGAISLTNTGSEKASLQTLSGLGAEVPTTPTTLATKDEGVAIYAADKYFFLGLSINSYTYYNDNATTIIKNAVSRLLKGESLIEMTISQVCANPQYILSDINMSDYTYTLTLSSLDGATVYYTLNGGAKTKYTEALTLKRKDVVVAIAEQEGRTSSEEVTITAPDLSGSGTESLAAPSQSGIDVVGACYTIPSTYNGGSANNVTGVKMKIANGAVCNVNTGYIINKIEVTAIGNACTFDLTGVYVDDSETSVLGETLSFENNGTSGSSKTSFSLYLNAQKSIKFTTDNIDGDQTQANVAIKFYYTIPDDPTTLHTVTFSADVDGFATFCPEKHVIIPEGVTAYIAKAENNALTLTEIEKYIPANTGVILKGTAGETAEFVTTGFTADVTGNELTGVTKATTVEANSVYGLSVKDDVVAFYKYAGTTIEANKAYYKAPAAAESTETSTAASAAVLRFNFGQEDGEMGNVTGINAVTIENRVDNVIYDLRGRRVQSLDRPGLYIVNGKKVAIQ